MRNIREYTLQSSKTAPIDLQTKIQLFRSESFRSATKHPFNHPVHLNSSKKQGYSIVESTLAIISGTIWTREMACSLTRHPVSSCRLIQTN